ncbi:MAG TPA: BMP family ABC transporter substrate-binding protein [Firmicutes bacterium]|nr:BMP family ABC transporter substrate-binding protein [Bacillota bacterium]
MGKKILALLLAGATLLAVTACGPSASNAAAESASAGESSSQAASEEAPAEGAGIPADQIKVGFVYSSAHNDEGYSQAHDIGRQAVEAMGIETAYVENVAETNEACESAIRNLIDQGCNVIYTNSFGFMEATANCAAEFPEVKFGHCSGYTTAENMNTYFGKIYQARYLSGIVAGMKTQVNRIGYVAAMPIPEVIRGINAFTLGVRSVNPEATVEVIWTNTWYDPAVEKQAALEIINTGVDVVAQHQNTTAPQIAAQERGVYAVGYNMSSPDAAPDAYLTAPIFNWDKFYTADVQRVIDGTWTGTKIWDGLETGLVDLDTLTANAPEGAQEAVDTAKEQIISGELHPFAGPLTNQAGEVVVPEGTTMTDDEIWNMNWFVEGVVGDIPA